MIQIKPKEIGLPPTEATQLSLRSEFEIGAETSRLFWQVFDVDNNQILYGNLDVDYATHLNWGTDDTIIEDYALNNLGLERL